MVVLQISTRQLLFKNAKMVLVSIKRNFPKIEKINTQQEKQSFYNPANWYQKKSSINKNKL